MVKVKVKASSQLAAKLEGSNYRSLTDVASAHPSSHRLLLLPHRHRSRVLGLGLGVDVLHYVSGEGLALSVNQSGVVDCTQTK
jgi:hypothetical protein